MMKMKNGIGTVDVLNMIFEDWEDFSDEEKLTLANLLERKIVKSAVGYDYSMDIEEDPYIDFIEEDADDDFCVIEEDTDDEFSIIEEHSDGEFDIIELLTAIYNQL